MVQLYETIFFCLFFFSFEVMPIKIYKLVPAWEDETVRVLKSAGYAFPLKLSSKNILILREITTNQLVLGQFCTIQQQETWQVASWILYCILIILLDVLIAII